MSCLQSRKRGTRKMALCLITQTAINTSIFRGLYMTKTLRASWLGLRLLRRRMRMRLSVLGFASKPQIAPANSASNSLTCGMMFCCSGNQMFHYKTKCYGKKLGKEYKNKVQRVAFLKDNSDGRETKVYMIAYSPEELHRHTDTLATVSLNLPEIDAER